MNKLSEYQAKKIHEEVGANQGLSGNLEINSPDDLTGDQKGNLPWMDLGSGDIYRHQ